MRFEQASALLRVTPRPVVRALVVTQLDAVFRGEPLHRFGKAETLDLAQEGEYVAARPATEAMVEALRRPDVEGRRFFVVERAEAFARVRAGLAQSHILFDDFVYSGAFADELHILVLDESHHDEVSLRE